MKTIGLNDVLEYLEGLDDDREFYTDGYCDSCVVANYTKDAFNVPYAYYTGRIVMSEDGTLLAETEEAVWELVCGIEDRVSPEDMCPSGTRIRVDDIKDAAQAYMLGEV